MRPFRFLALCAGVPLCVPGQAVNMRGFLNKDLAAESKLEEQARAVPDAKKLRSYMEEMAGEPHNAGSARSKEVAQYLAGLLREWGLDVSIEQFEALMPYPTMRQVEMVSPKHFTAELKEPVVSVDPDSGDAQQLPTYNAYAASGDVTGEVVYANFGLPDDYEWLEKHGISVKGKIVLTRYGKSWRGIKPKLAAEHGAIACLIYSDPHEDGYFEGDGYPKGPMRPSHGAQRGSVLDMPLYPGDPLSPGWASEKGSKRLAISEAKTLVKIPVLPLSYGDAQPILEQLTGPLVPREWRGALPLTYHAGPGATVLHMKTDYDWTTKPIFDVIASIPGAETPDRWIMAGNHHDAWVNGADDPVSGAVALLESARALASLHSQGWKPKRTIKFAFWDGEEFGLLGSTEWAEKHQSELKEKLVAYLNSDSTGRGWIHISGSHTLESFAAELAASINQPGSSSSLMDAAMHHPPAADAEEGPAPAKPEKPFSIGALGAGSDYVAFLDYLGVASMNEGFGGQSKGGIYHSVYDSLYWYTHFSDGTFVDGQALAQFTSTALMRLANASVLPFEFVRFTNTVNGYLDEIEKQAKTGGGPGIDLSALHEELATLKQSGEQFDTLLEDAMKKPSLDAGRAAALNDILERTERVLTRPDGLPNRSWYKHQIYAPGFLTGYDVKTVPGVREAVESKNWGLAQKEAQIVRQCLSEMNQLVSEANSGLSGL